MGVFMTTTLPPTTFAEAIIRNTSAYLQTTPLVTLAEQYAHPKVKGRLSRASLLAKINSITIQRSNNLLRYCQPLEVFFSELETLMSEQGLFSTKSTTVKVDKKAQKCLSELSDEDLIALSGQYHDIKDMSERNDSLRKYLTKRGLMNDVRLTHPTYTTSQAYVGLNKELILKSVYELIFANVLTYAGISFDYDVDSGIRNKTESFTIDFEIFFGDEQSVFVELAQNLYVDASCQSPRRNDYANNLSLERGKYLHELTNKNVHFIDKNKPYHAFYEDIVQWLTNYAPQADIASFSIAMVKQNEELEHLLDEPVESVAFRLIDEYQGVANFKNKYSRIHTYLRQRNAGEYNEIMRLANVMSKKLHLQKSHSTRYRWSKPSYFTFRQFCQSIFESGLLKLVENKEVFNLQEAYQKWIFGYDLHRAMFELHGIKPPTNQFCPTPQTFYEEFESWDNFKTKRKRAA
jgi:hypothetical protein